MSIPSITLMRVVLDHAMLAAGSVNQRAFKCGTPDKCSYLEGDVKDCKWVRGLIEKCCSRLIGAISFGISPR